MNKLLKINEVAKKYDTTKRTLRYYEEAGLLKAKRMDFSNYRYYDDGSLKRLEQILLLRKVGFKITEVKQILLSNDKNCVNTIFQNKLREMKLDIDNLVYFRKVIETIMKIKNEKGTENINLYELLKEQVYSNEKMERMIKMSEYIEDTIIVEFGIDVCKCCKELISGVKKLRPELQKEYKIEIPLVRIRDIDDLKADEYRILIKGITAQNGSLKGIDEDKWAGTILTDLKNAVVSNIKNI